MDKKKIFDFLRDLDNHNSKEWMDAHRGQYTEAKSIWLNEVQLILKRLAVHDKRFANIEPSQTITRINNNRRFQPDKPVYKDNFTTTPYGSFCRPSFHISVSPNGSFIAGGVYMPDAVMLRKIREAIDAEGNKLVEIINQKDFVKFYGGISEDEEKLRSAPKGFDKSHPHIELLKMKNFFASKDITEKQIISADFAEYVEQAFLIVLPLIQYLERAVNYEE